MAEEEQFDIEQLADTEIDIILIVPESLSSVVVVTNVSKEEVNAQ